MDLTGMKFGRLTVLGRNSTDYITPSTGKHQSRWDCVCECGNTTTVVCGQLNSGKTKSCGCLQKERSAEAHTKHGYRYERLHSVWANMKNRCYNKNYKEYNSYGGRGIKVCDEWQKYEPFREWAMNNGYDESRPRGQLTLDRIEVDGMYEPSNCRFVNMHRQANNKTDNVFVTYLGESHTISEWASLLGVSYHYLYYRFRTKHMSMSEIIASI